MSTAATTILPAEPSKIVTRAQQENLFRDDVIKVFGRQTYVVNFLIGHVPEKRFVVGQNLEAVKAGAEKWCTLKRYRFTSVHPFFFDMYKEIRELESLEGDNTD